MSLAQAVADSAEVIDYDALHADYLVSLVDTLRGFSAKVPGLELWVPDDSPPVSLQSLLDSACSLGRTGLTLLFGAATLSRTSERELLLVAQAFGSARFERRGSGLLLHVSELTPPAQRSAPTIPARVTAQPARDARSAAPAPTPSPSEQRSAVDIYLPALERARAALPQAPEQLPEGGVHVSASRDGCSLELAISPQQLVLGAAFSAGAPLDAALLSQLCGGLRGLPLLEACYHGASRLEHALRPRPQQRAVAGIVLPCAAHPRFALVEQLLQDALAAYRKQSGFAATLNEYDERPAAAWLAADDAARRALLESALGAVLPELGLPASEVTVASIRHDVRVELAFGDAWRELDQPKLVLALEAALRARVDARLEVYVEELKDRNKLRRLAVVENGR